MAIKGPFMISLAVMSGACVWGCMSAALPPAASVPRQPAWTVPGLARVEPRSPSQLPVHPLPPLQPVPPVVNPWRPAVPEREWRSIVIHHTATARGDVESIHQAHLRRKDKAGNPWQGIGYHFVIGNGNGMGDGEIEPTFRWREQLHGAHAGDREHNDHGIGIVLIGNFDDGPPTAAQLTAVKRLVAVLKADYSIAGEKVIGHADVKATACPGKYFPLADVR